MEGDVPSGWSRCEARRGAGRDGRTDARWPACLGRSLALSWQPRVIGSDYLDSFLSKKSSGGQAQRTSDICTMMLGLGLRGPWGLSLCRLCPVPF